MVIFHIAYRLPKKSPAVRGVLEANRAEQGNCPAPTRLKAFGVAVLRQISRHGVGGGDPSLKTVVVPCTSCKGDAGECVPPPADSTETDGAGR